MSLVTATLLCCLLSACMPAPSREDYSPGNIPGESKVLVVYFSCTGTTEGIAELIAENTAGALYEIIAEDPYTPEDLDYYSGGRADQEQADPSFRPAISGKAEGMTDYDIIFLGYPIWHGQAPRIISTFLEQYDFAGKTIVPFCTSGSSGIGSSATALHALAPAANWLEGRRFSGSESREAIAAWLGEINL